MAATADGAPLVSAHGGRLRAVLELGKLRLSAMALLTVVAGGLLATPAPDGGRIAVAAAGGLLVATGGGALNMWLERDADARMRRTAGRPLPSGRLAPATAAMTGLVAAAVGLSMLALWTTASATLLCALILVTYVGVYTPLKRVTVLNTWIGAVPGALPPVVGWVAVGGDLDRRALALFAILYCWQIPHFLAIAWRHREDYARGGMRMLPVACGDGRATGRCMLAFTAAHVAASLLPWWLGMAGSRYLAAAAVLDTAYAAVVAVAAARRRNQDMRRAFHASLLYLPLLLTALVLDRA